MPPTHGTEGRQVQERRMSTDYSGNPRRDGFPSIAAEK